MGWQHQSFVQLRRRIVQQDPTRAQLLLLVKRSAVFRRLPADRGTSPDVPSQPTHPRFITRLAVWHGTPALGSDQLERLAPPRACARGLSPASRPGARPPRFHHEGKCLRGTCFKHWMSDLRAHGVHGVGRGACPARQIRPFWPLGSGQGHGVSIACKQGFLSPPQAPPEAENFSGF